MTNGPPMGYQGAVPPMPGQYPPQQQPGVGYPQQPGVPGSHMNRGYPPGPVRSLHCFRILQALIIFFVDVLLIT